jgi:hypothetical protein
MWTGERGQPLKKPMIFMEISAKEFNYKSKQITSVQEIFEMIEIFEAFSVFIYSGTTVQKDHLVESYKKGNNLLMPYIGGLYDVVDALLSPELNNDKDELVEDSIVSVTDVNKLYALSEKTADTAIEMERNGLN